MAPAFRQCESHPERLLSEHLLDVAGRLRARSSGRWLELAGLFHDVGKATSFFQSYLHGGSPPPLLKAHSEFGAAWLLEFLLRTQSRLPCIEAALACLVVRRH